MSVYVTVRNTYKSVAKQMVGVIFFLEKIHFYVINILFVNQNVFEGSDAE